MAWVFLIVAGLLEIVWAIALKKSEGFTDLTASAVFLVASVASFVLLAKALESLPVGTGYAVWTGIGAVGAAIVGIMLLGESAEPLRLAAIAVTAVGIVSLGALSA
jgi:quaternary ammonium compound-resistance protein SugE